MVVKLLLITSLSLEAISVWLYCYKLFVIKQRKWVSFWFTASLYLFLYMTHSFADARGVIINLFLFFFTNFLLIKIIYVSSFSSAVIHSSLLTFLSVISEIVTGYVCDKVIANYWSNWNEQINLLYMSISCFLFFLSTYLLSLFQKKYVHNDFSKKSEFTIFLIISLCTTIVTLLIFFYILSANLSSEQQNVVIVCIILLSIIFLLNVLLYNYMQKKQMDYSLMQKQIQFENDTKTLIEEIEKRETSQRILIHDIKNHLNSLASLCSDEEATKDYIAKLISSPALKAPLQYCSNDFVNAIIYRYSQNAKNLNIKFNVEITNVSLNHISNFDLTVIFCNLLDNAFEASLLCENPEVTLILSSDIEKKINIIKISNTCLDSVDIKKLTTTKEDIHFHGYGLVSVAASLGKYGGNFHQYKENSSNIFTSIVIINWGVS